VPLHLEIAIFFRSFHVRVQSDWFAHSFFHAFINIHLFIFVGDIFFNISLLLQCCEMLNDNAGRDGVGQQPRPAADSAGAGGGVNLRPTPASASAAT